MLETTTTLLVPGHVITPFPGCKCHGCHDAADLPRFQQKSPLCWATACCTPAWHTALPFFLLFPLPGCVGASKTNLKTAPSTAPSCRCEAHFTGLSGEAQRESPLGRVISPQFWLPPFLPVCYSLCCLGFFSLVFLFLLSHSHVTFSVPADTSCSQSAVVSPV